jgi:hypothetical protein
MRADPQFRVPAANSKRGHEIAGSRSDPPAYAPRLACAITASCCSFRDQDDFTPAFARAGRGQQHLEARYTYEAKDSGSLFAGWRFFGGEEVTGEVAPVVGVVFGQKLRSRESRRGSRRPSAAPSWTSIPNRNTRPTPWTRRTA